MSKLKSKIFKFKCFRLVSNILFIICIISFFFFSVANHSLLTSVGVVSALVALISIATSELFEYLINENTKVYNVIKYKKLNNPINIIEFKNIA